MIMCLQVILHVKIHVIENYKPFRENGAIQVGY